MALLEVTPRSGPDIYATEGIGSFVTTGPDGLRFRGDDTGGRVLYLTATTDSVLASHELAELLDALRKRGEAPSISAESLSFFLHDGQVPFPATIYEDVFALSIGDRALVKFGNGPPELRFSLEFPYFSRLSRESEDPDPNRLLTLLSVASSELLAGDEGAALLLSSGKDSTALALALAEAGRTDVTCLTYAGEGDDEHVFAADVCRRLGLTHRTISLDTGGADIGDTLERFFTESPQPAGDMAQIPVVLAMASLSGDVGAVVEGSGNDVTFGYVPRRKDRIAAGAALGRWGWADGLKRLLPPGSQLNYLLRDPVEINWPGLRVRYPDSQRLLKDAHNTSRHWRSVRRRLGSIDSVDARALLRGRHFEIGSQKEKVGLAARVFSIRAVHPYQDHRVIDYYFNLPRDSRYDRARMVNKVLLRRLLKERLEYDESVVGSRGFAFDGTAFVHRFADLIRQEVLSCAVLDSHEAERLLVLGFDHVDKGPFVWHHIVGLFQFAAWHNHSRFLSR